MRTFRQYFKQSLTLFFFIANFLVYSSVFAEVTETDAHHVQSSLWSGVYHGFIPCDDCKGVKITLALNKNNSYLLISQYVGKSDREIVEKGKFTWDDENTAIVLTPRNSTQTRQYFVGEGTLIQLDSDGKRITGDASDRYILRRTEITGTPSQTTHH